MVRRAGGNRAQASPGYLETLLVELVGDPMAVFDSEGRSVRVNGEFDELFPKLSALHDLLAQVAPPAAGQKIDEKFRRGPQGNGPVRGDLRHKGNEHAYEADFLPGPVPRFYLRLTSGSTQPERARRDFEREKHQSLTTLAAGIIHNFNNILAGIKGYAELIGRYPEPVADTVRAYADGIAHLADRGAQLNQKLLSFAAPARRSNTPISVNGFLRELVAKSSAMAESDRCQVHFKPLAGDMFFIGDPFQLTDAFMNIVANAIEAIEEEPGGVTVKAVHSRRRRGRRTGAAAQLSQRWIEIIVADSGRGMTRDELARAFDPFFTTKTQDEALGMGLPMAMGIIRNHGGEIRLVSTLGRGTTARIILPVYELPVAHSAGALPEARTRTIREGVTALIVDDEPDIIKILQRLLLDMGIRVHIAGSGRTAEAVLDSELDRIDLVILDAILEDMSGIGLYLDIRRRKPDVPVLFVSGQDLPRQNPQLFIESPAAAFMMKPFRIADFQQKVRALLGLA